MAVIEVVCPNPTCGARLKAPEDRIGKKAKCKKCREGFRIPGPVPMAESVEEPMLSAMALPAPALPEPGAPVAAEVLDEVEPLPDPEPVPVPKAKPARPAAPGKNLADLPSADPFDFQAPAAKPANPAAKPAPIAEPLPAADLDDDEPPTRKSHAKAKKAAEPEPEPEPAPANNPFSFGSADEPAPEKPKRAKRRDEDEDEERPRKKKRDEEEEAEEKPRKKKPTTDEDEKPRKKKRAEEGAGAEDEGKPRYTRPEEKAGMGKAVALSAVVALVALGLAATAGVMFVRSNRTAEVKKEEKKEEPPAPVVAPPLVTPPVTPKDKVEPKPKDKDPEPKPKDKEPGPKPKDKEPEPAPGRPSVVLDGKFKSVTAGKEPAKFESADKPGEPRFIVDAPFASVVRVFPPFDPKTADTYIVTRTGVRLSLDAFSPSSGARVSRLEFVADPKPLCDVHATATEARFLAVSGGRISVWNLADQKKLADAIDPYADKPEHAKNGLAAVYFAPKPEQVVTVSTAGAVHLFDLSTKAVVSEFVPPHGSKGAVVQGESVARGGADSIALAVGGIVYQIKSAPGLDRVRAHDLGGDVKPLAVASSGAPGRLVFAFEVEVKGKKEKERALLALPFQGDQRNLFLLPAATTGTPKGAFWVHDTEVGVVTERGVVWFGENEGKFGPVVVTRPVADALYTGSGSLFWYLVPRPSNAAQSVLTSLAVPFGDAATYRSGDAAKPLRVVRIDQNGLAK